MKMNYVLIDFENVQPKNLKLLIGGPYQIKVFLGVNQTKLPRDVVTTMQIFGADAEYIELASAGQNALDFHIAFFVGQLLNQTPDAFIHIISKDTGFDSLIKFLQAKKLHCYRYANITDIPLLKIQSLSSPRDKTEAVIDHLKQRGSARPRTLKTLINSINSLFANKLTIEEVNQLVGELKSQNVMRDENNKLIYTL